jgi:hypothetical protein
VATSGSNVVPRISLSSDETVDDKQTTYETNDNNTNRNEEYLIKMLTHEHETNDVIAKNTFIDEILDSNQTKCLSNSDFSLNEQNEFLQILSCSPTLESLWQVAEKINDPFKFMSLLVSFFRSNKLQLSREMAESLIDIYYPFLSESKNTENLTNVSKYHYALQDLIICVMKQYPSCDSFFQIFTFRILTDLLILMRRSTGDFLIQNFRCFADIYSSQGPNISKDVFERLVVDFCLTFIPTHPLFTQSCMLINNNVVHGFDTFCMLKILIRMKIALNMKVFELIDHTLSNSEGFHSDIHFIIEFLFQTAVLEIVWSNTALSLIKKHARHILSHAKTKKWSINFIRRTFQWMELCKKNGRYKNRRTVIAHAMYVLANGAPEIIRAEIYSCASTLIMSGLMTELNQFFEPSGAYDQTLLDEIDVMELRDDVMEQLCSPVEKLRPDQIRRIEAKRFLLDNNPLSDDEAIKQSDGFETSILKSINYFSVIIALILTIVVLVIFS